MPKGLIICTKVLKFKYKNYFKISALVNFKICYTVFQGYVVVILYISVHMSLLVLFSLNLVGYRSLANKMCYLAFIIALDIFK